MIIYDGREYERYDEYLDHDMSFDGLNVYGVMRINELRSILANNTLTDEEKSMRIEKLRPKRRE